MGGWIKLHRQIWDSFLWQDKPFNRKDAWIDLLLMTNSKDGVSLHKGIAYEVKRGQCLTSVRKLSDRWGWGKDRTLSFLRLLEAEQMIIKDSDNNRTLLTIVNYEVYQGVADSNKDTDKDSDKDTEPTVSRQSQGQSQGHGQATNKNIKNIENDKKDKNEKNVKKEIFGEYRNVKLTHEEYERLGTDYGEDMRKDLIAFLDAYIEEKGYQSKSHNLAIRRWVVDAVKRQKPKQNPESDFFAALDACV